MHLAKYMHDVVYRITETWCGEWTGGATEILDRATCRLCCVLATAYGIEVGKRLTELRKEADEAQRDSPPPLRRDTTGTRGDS